MDNRVSTYLRQDTHGTEGRLGQYKTPRGNHVDRVTLLLIGIRTMSANVPSMLTTHGPPKRPAKKRRIATPANVWAKPAMRGGLV
jgi:hypothetical protein